ncbi:MAG TPA: hypothetical protein VEY12_07825 [Thermoplasmata archaeon]|nr:hypothetical protein [Thermoplasmata archaeon]
MNPSQMIGSPWVTYIAGAVTLAYCAGLGWLVFSIYRMTPELLQLQLFRKVRGLQNSVTTMGLGLMVWMVMTTLFVADITLPDPVWILGLVLAAGLLGLGMYRYARVMSIPRTPPGS